MNEEAFPTAGLKIVVVPLPRKARWQRAAHIAVNWARHTLPTSTLMPLDALKSLDQQSPVDVVFAHFGTCGIAVLPACERLGVPLVTMLHSCDLGSWLASWSYRTLLPRLFSRGDVFIVASDFMRKRAIALGCDPAKIQIIPPCPVPAPGRQRSTEEAEESASQLIFLHVGRLHEQKGILFSIRAFALVHRAVPRSRLVIVGDGPQRSEAEHLTHDLGLTHSVIFKGALPFSAVSEELHAADIYVIHSMTSSRGDTEGFGVSVAEASGAGLPVIATRHNGFPELVSDGETGLLVAEGDVEGMATAMKTLANSPALRAAMGEAGTQHIRQRLSMPAVAGQFEQLFYKLSETSHHRR